MDRRIGRNRNRSTEPLSDEAAIHSVDTFSEAEEENILLDES